MDSFGPHADPSTGRSPPALRAAVVDDLAGVFGRQVIEEQLLEEGPDGYCRPPLGAYTRPLFGSTQALPVG